MKERAVWISMGLLTVSVGALLGLRMGGIVVLVVTPILVLAMAGVGRMMSRPADREWLTTLVVFGFVAKLAGSGARYLVIRYVYGGGDAFGYYRVGTEFAHQWRAGNPPPLSGNRGEGTQVMEAITGVVFAPFLPDFLGGFFLFAALSFFGQLALYAAIRRWAPSHQLKIVASLIFFLPSYVFWPSSIGKDAVMLLGLGIAAYCVARCMEAYETRWLVGAGLAVAGMGFIRVHISALFVGALLMTAIVAKPRSQARVVGLRRLTLIVLLAVIGFLTVNAFQARYGTNLLDAGDVESFSESVVDRTSKGTTVPGGAVTTPADVPEAVVFVLFRPFIWEAGEFQVLLSALETTFLLGLLIWKLPAMYRNRKKWRSNSLVVFSTLYVLAFSIAFSAVRNLGIIARQRTQVLAFLLIVIIALGWDEPQARKRRSTSPSRPDIATRQLVSVGDSAGVRQSE
ncbi:MAG: glycosyltransferase family 39 protein [Acidimicrobiia bacterium]